MNASPAPRRSSYARRIAAAIAAAALAVAGAALVRPASHSHHSTTAVESWGQVTSGFTGIHNVSPDQGDQTVTASDVESWG